jgi:fyn-related kinase
MWLNLSKLICHLSGRLGCFSFKIIFFRWYFGKIKPIEAEKKLLMPQNEHGAFLIRDSESRRNDFSLSVRDGDTVKHYRIRQLDEGGFFIARRTTFRTLQELVDHYSRDADGLCVNLRKACVQVCLVVSFCP